MEPHMCSLDTNKKKRKESHEKKTESWKARKQEIIFIIHGSIFFHSIIK
jgi:hypothetical protein